MDIDLLSYKKFYFIGIKGVGMTMLAQFLHSRGKEVSGSDITDVFMTDAVLKKEGISFRAPFNPGNIPAGTVIIHSSAFTVENNAEVAYLEKNKDKFKRFPILNYAQAVGALFSSYRGIAVCGSHGKTTVSAWLGYVLRKAGIDANVLVGACVPQFKGSAVIGKSDLFVAEADEYQNKLQYFYPHGIVLNNIDYDHPDYFKNRRAYAGVFSAFTAKLKKDDFLVANAADAEIAKILPAVKGKIFTYALADKLKKKQAAVTLVGHSVRRENGWQYFQVNDFGEFKIRLLGSHNIENALAVLTAGLAVGLEPWLLKKALADFRGTARRAELMGKYKGISVYDDYGHHPTEVQATLKAFKEAFPKQRLVAVFHPHTFTRTKALYKDFIKSFDEVDVLGILEIYGSAREVQGGISSRDLISGLKAGGRKKTARYLANFDDALVWLKKTLRPGDVLVLMGAGDIFRVGERLIKK